MPFLGSGEFQTPTFPDELVVAVRRLNSVSDGKVGVWNSPRLPGVTVFTAELFSGTGNVGGHSLP
jgi:hypothetical protein